MPPTVPPAFIVKLAFVIVLLAVMVSVPVVVKKIFPAAVRTPATLMPVVAVVPVSVWSMSPPFVVSDIALYVHGLS